jgi:hypothetical protein
MRLINTDTIKLVEFQPGSIPPYAILSHRWGVPEDEILFRDFDIGASLMKKAYKKIYYACRQAQADGLGYIWIDTCCIDKASSAELSEAINSMYSFYQNSSACYVFLADVLLGVAVHSREDCDGSFADRFATSSWFKRGW